MGIDNQRAVSELLRSADKAIKEGNLDNALAAISKVFEFDQRNVYARAYQERILSLKEMQMAAKQNADKIPPDSEQKLKESVFSIPKSVAPGASGARPAAPAAPHAAPSRPVPPPASHRQEQSRPQAEEPKTQAPAPAEQPASVFVPIPEHQVQEQSPAADTSAAQGETPSPEAPASDAPPAEPSSSEVPALEERSSEVPSSDAPAVGAAPDEGSPAEPPASEVTAAEVAPTEGAPTDGAPTEVGAAEVPAPAAPADDAAKEVPMSVSSPLFEYVKQTPARLDAYKTLLAEIWTVGTFTELEDQRVAAVRQSFAITDDEHARIERDIRFAAYMTAIESAWKKGVTSFDDMRKQYRITDQEHLQIEGRVFRLLQSLRSVGTVLLIDDDPEFLSLASRQLTEAGFYCVSVPTCEEALFVLDSLTPNVVVCDVNFSKPNMSGFAFYERFRSIERFFPVPFIFLSGMVQEAVQRTGMQMGADSYFTKPIDLELFLATIEGKIKRSYELQQRLTPHHL